MIKLDDLLGVINCDERVKIIGAEMYSGITGNVEELESALNDSIMHNYVSNVTYDDAVICIYVQPDRPYGDMADDDTNGWRCVDDELPKYSGRYLVLCRKSCASALRYDVAYFDNMTPGWATDEVVQYWCELPKYEPEEDEV